MGLLSPLTGGLGFVQVSEYTPTWLHVSTYRLRNWVGRVSAHTRDDASPWPKRWVGGSGVACPPLLPRIKKF